MDDKGIKAADLLGAYSTGTLKAAERRKLLEAALADQAIFNALADEETLREALEDAAFRDRVIARLRALERGAPGGVLRRTWIWLRRPVVIGPAVAVAALVCVMVLRLGPNDPEPGRTAPAGYGVQPKGLDLSSEPRADVVAFGEFLRRGRRAPPGLADLDLNREGRVPAYAVGDTLRFEFSVSRDAAALLLLEDPAGAVERLFPSRRQPSSRVVADTRVQIPRAGQGYRRVSGPAGRYRLTLLVFPPGVNPLGPVASEPRPLAVRREYEVVR